MGDGLNGLSASDGATDLQIQKYADEARELAPPKQEPEVSNEKSGFQLSDPKKQLRQLTKENPPSVTYRKHGCALPG